MKIRSLAWLAIAAQPLFVASWLIAGALEPGYSHADSVASALAAHGAEHPWIVMAGLAALGLSALALAPGLKATLPPRTASTTAVALFAIVGGLLLVTALAQPTCESDLRSCESGGLHGWAGFIAMLALLATPFVLARALWPSPVGGLALLAGSTGLAVGVAATLLYSGTAAPDGTIERAELLTGQAWLVIVAIGILHETRPAPRYSDPAPLRPRDFFGSAWEGTGQVRPWPYALWSVTGPAFTISRTTTWKSDDVGLVRDRAVFRSGRVEERVRFAHLLDPGHIHVSGDDLPDGADVRIDEAGFRIAPFKAAAPVGPLRFIVTCHSDVLVEPDGTVAYDVRVRWHGLPVARLDLRARPIDTTSTPEQSPRAVLAG